MGGGIVSNNPCIDAILVELVPAERIAAISQYSLREGGSSMGVAKAQRFHAIGGTAEEIISLRPEVALVGAHTPAGTLDALRRAGIRVEVIGVANSVTDSVAQVHQIGRAVKAHAEADVLVTAIEQAAAPANRATDRTKDLLIWQNGGLVPGPGTLMDDLIKRAGFSNAANRYGLGPWDLLPLEPVVRNPPDIIVSPTAKGDASDSLRDRWLSGPNNDVRHAQMPAHLLYCGGPTIIEAMGFLRALGQGS